MKSGFVTAWKLYEECSFLEETGDLSLVSYLDDNLNMRPLDLDLALPIKNLRVLAEPKFHVLCVFRRILLVTHARTSVGVGAGTSRVRFDTDR
jgi:hypothetical protein